MAQAYGNRTDLNNPANKMRKMAATGQTYGSATEQMRSQAAVPMGGSPAEQVPAPGSMGGLDRMTERPSEPITAGMNFGEGPGPEVLAAPGQVGVGSRDDLIQRVRMAAAQNPNPNLIQLLIMLEGQ